MVQEVRRRGHLGVTVSLPLLLAGCAPEGLSFLTPGGPVAAAERAQLIFVTLVALVVVAPVLIGTPLLVWRYRRRARALYRPDWEFSAPLEVAMWGIPALVVGVLGWQLARETVALDPFAPLSGGAAPVQVEAIGLNWKWLFVYPDAGVASLNELVFPAGVPLDIRLTSDTVMQSFFIGALAGQVYAMPGMETRLNVQADAPGEFRGVNTQFNGAGFPQQSFTARAVPSAEFSDWLGKVKAEGVPLDREAYATLAHDSTPAAAATAFAAPGVPEGVGWFSNVTPDLFGSVLARYISGDPVPSAAQPGSPDYEGAPPPAAVAPGGQ